MLGPDQPVMLYMLDISLAAEALNGVKMELIDVAFPLLKGVVATTVVVEACTGVNIAAMVGGFPRKEGMERKDVIYKKVSVYKAQASALEQYVAKDYKDGLDDSYWNFYNIAPRQGFGMLQIEIKAPFGLQRTDL